MWLRGFADMDSRRAALEAFYGGPVWKQHSAEANATMLEVDDVLLLRPLHPTTGFGELPLRPDHGEQRPASVVVATICSLAGPADADVIDAALAELASPPLAVLVTEPSENTFPALPVRTGEHVVVWLERAEEVARVDVPGMLAEPVRLRLEPTARSQLR